MIIIADIFTLKTINSLPISGIQYGQIIPDSNYAILVSLKNQIIIIDVIQAQVVLVLDNRIYPNTDLEQYYCQTFRFKYTDKLIIVVSTSQNLISWSFDDKKLTSNYNGPVQYSILFHSNLIQQIFFNLIQGEHQNKYSRKFIKHPTEDIIFMGGENCEIIALKVLSFEQGQYKLMMKISNFSLQDICQYSYKNNISIKIYYVFQIFNMSAYSGFSKKMSFFIVQIKPQTNQILQNEKQNIIMIIEQLIQTIFKNQINIKIDLFNGQVNKLIQAMTYIEIKQGGQVFQFLFVGQGTHVIQVFLVIDLLNNQIIAPYASQPFQIEIPNREYFYTFKENTYIMMSSEFFVGIWDYKEQIRLSYLYLPNNQFSKKLVGQLNGFEILIHPFNNFVIINSKNDINKDIMYAPKFSYFLLDIYSGFFGIQNCQNCVMAKLRNRKQDSSFEDFLSTVDIFPLEQKDTIINIMQEFQFYWELVSYHLDPFKYKDKIWVAIGFLYKQALSEAYQDALFYLINVKDAKNYIKLKSSDNSKNRRNTSFALASFGHIDNPEIIGFDSFGTIYFWDIASENFDFKYSFDFDKCKSPNIAEIFYFQKKKIIVIGCGDGNIFSIDISTQKDQFIRRMGSTPIFNVRVFQNISVLALGDTLLGETFIYKFNASTEKFDYLFTIYPSYLKESLIWIELLRDNTLWIQYNSRQLFFSLGDCLDDTSHCTQCQQTYYFNTNNQINGKGGAYGEGKEQIPFTTSSNFLVSMLKAQRYKQNISGITNMKVDIIISPEKTMNLDNELINFDFTPQISINFKSSKQDTNAKIQYLNKLIFKNYFSISIENINLYYYSDRNECGMVLINILNNAYINNIQQIANFPTQNSCQTIYVDSTYLQIKKYEIIKESYANDKFIINTINSPKIIIENFTLKDCELGEYFSILKQVTNINAEIQTLQLTDNYCIQNLDENSSSSSLFNAGLYKINNVQITGNTFCNKNIFSTISSKKQINQIFELSNVEVSDNTFQSQTSYIFFNVLYPMISQPSHELRMNNIKFKSNKLEQKFSNQLSTASFVQANNIAIQQYNQIDLENHSNIQFSLLEFAQEITINDFDCVNDSDYLKTMDNKVTFGCIQINEVKKVTINKIRIMKKKAQDNPLFMMENNQVNQAILNINDGEFKDLILNQSQKNSQASPIFIKSSYEIILTMTNNHFENNSLQNGQYTLTYSTTALFVENFVGKVIIKDSSFKNCQSDSKYNFMYIQSNLLSLDNVNLQKSSYTIENDSNKNIFNQEGGMMNVKVNSLQITDSTFEQSIALKGSFLFILSFGQILKIDIQNTKFSEGYSQGEGSAFFIDTGVSQLDFNCQQCYFNNIHTMQPQSSAISFEKYAQYGSEKNKISFNGGEIRNVIGLLDNYFIESINSVIKFDSIPEISYKNYDSSDYVHKLFYQNETKQQSTLLNLIDSEAQINNCQFYNLNITNPSSTFPLLINSQNSIITFKKSKVRDSQFYSSAIKLEGGMISFQESKFLNVNQPSSIRILEEVIEQIPSESAHSLIIVQNGSLEAIELSQFSNIKCDKNCNGGVFQIINGNINLQNTKITNTYGSFGGGIFISGLNGKNSITDVDFQNCNSQYDGGAIYFKATKIDQFNLAIISSRFIENISSNKSGAIYIRSDVLNSPNQIIEINKSNFFGNRANIGGAINNQNISPKIIDSTFQNNKGILFGNDIISYPSKLNLVTLPNLFKTYDIKKDIENYIEINNFRSGDSLNNLVFQFMNDNNEIIVPVINEDYVKYSVQAEINPSTVNITQYNIRGDLTAYYNKDEKGFKFSSLAIVGVNGTSAIFQFKSNQIQVLNKEKNVYENNYLFKIRVNFRQCVIGEQILNYNSLSECDICKENKYSYSIDQLCKNCPSGAICHGGINVVAKQGYWRKTNESDQFISCDNLEENCSGGSFGDDICYEGHVGALCEECDIYGEKWGHSYSKSAKYSCARCDKIKGNIWIVILMTIWTVISMTIAIKGSIETLQMQAAALTIQRNLKRKQIAQFEMRQKKSSISKSNEMSNTFFARSTINFDDENLVQSNDDDKTAIYIKMFTSYMQIVGSIATFNLAIPSGIFEFPQSVGQPLKQTMNSLDCALEQLDTDVPIIYLRLMFSMLIPFGYIILFLLGVTVNNLIKKTKEFPWYILSTAVMFLIIYVQPDLVSQIIALLSCRKIGDTEYILSNVSFECHTSEHLRYIAFLIVPLLLLWVFILPIILFLMLRKNRDKLSTIQIKLKYGFLYKEYKNRAFYWEFIKMAEKIAIILSLNFYSQSIPTKGILVFVIITVYGVLSLIIEPYQESDVNQIDVNSTNICAATVLLGLFIYKNEYNYLIYIALTIIVIINCWFIIKLLKKIVGGYIPKLQEATQAIFTALSKKIPFFKKCVKEIQSQKKMNPIIKQKMRKVFQRYVDMTPHEKKKFIVKILKSQLHITHGHIFVEGDDDQSESSKQNKHLQENNQKQKDDKIDLELKLVKKKASLEIFNKEYEDNLQKGFISSSRNQILSKYEFYQSYAYNQYFEYKIAQHDEQNEQQFTSPDAFLHGNKEPKEQVVSEELIQFSLNDAFKND